MNYQLLEATPGFEPGNGGFANRCLTTWLRGREVFLLGGAEGIRTPDPLLAKQVL